MVQVEQPGVVTLRPVLARSLPDHRTAGRLSDLTLALDRCLMHAGAR